MTSLGIEFSSLCVYVAMGNMLLLLSFYFVVFWSGEAPRGACEDHLSEILGFALGAGTCLLYTSDAADDWLVV